MRLKLRFIEEGGGISSTYQQHLALFPRLKNTAVFKAFGGGFFHDGKITELALDILKRRLSFKIEAPNFYAQTERRFFSVDFECCFEGVELISFQSELIVDEVPKNLTFLRAEFNSLGFSSMDKLISFDNSFFENTDSRCELLLDCVADQEVLIAINFKRFSVRARDPLLYYLACQLTGASFEGLKQDE